MIDLLKTTIEKIPAPAEFHLASVNAEIYDVNFMYFEIGILYCLAAWGTNAAGKIQFRKFIHDHEPVIEAIIGMTYLVFAVKWQNILSGWSVPYIS